MSKFFALLLAIVGLLLLGIGLALTREQPAMLALAIAGGVITYFAYSIDGRRERLAAEQHGRETKLRIEALAKSSWKNGKNLEIKSGGVNVVIASLALTASVLFAYFSVSEAQPKWGMFAGSVLFSVFVLFALIRILRGIGKPALVLNNQGFHTPLHGTIPWREVGGINLQKITIRGATTITLSFQVQDYAKAVSNVHWTEWLLGFFGLGALKRKVIAVVLNSASEDPEVVAAIARLLWQQSTGMDHEWSPMLSNEYNQASRRAHEFIEHRKASNTTAEDILRDPDKALDELKNVEQFMQDVGTANSELRRHMTKIKWQVAIVLLVTIAWVLWLLVRSYI